MSLTFPASWVALSIRTSSRGPFLDPDGILRCTPNTARAYESLNVEYKTRFGYDLPVTEAGRVGERQNYLHDLYLYGGGNLALPQGSSIHERGNALDLGGRAVILGSTENLWLRSNAPHVGLIWTGARFSQVEPWHYEQSGLQVAGTGTPIGDDSMSAADVADLKAWLTTALYVPGQPYTWANAANNTAADAAVAARAAADALTKVRPDLGFALADVLASQVPVILDKIGKLPAVTGTASPIDYTALANALAPILAKAVNDDAAKRLVQ